MNIKFKHTSTIEKAIKIGEVILAIFLTSVLLAGIITVLRLIHFINFGV